MQTAPDVQLCPGISALPERSQVARLRVEQGTLAVPDGMDGNKIAVGAVEARLLFASPGDYAFRRGPLRPPSTPRSSRLRR